MKPETTPAITAPFQQSQPFELDSFLTRREVLAHIGVSNTTLYKLIKEGNFPKQIRLKHCTSVMWSRLAVHQWMEEQINEQ